MPIRRTVEQRPRFTVVRADGEPSLPEFLEFVEALAVESRRWPTARLLVDLRGIRTLTTVTQHRAVGESVVRHLAHLAQIASVVPADRITRASENTAQRAGVNMAVFTSEAEALQWLAPNRSEPPGNDPPGHVDLGRDPAAMQRIFASLGLAEPGEPVQPVALAGGVSSGIYRVDLRAGSFCLKQALPRLKVAKEWLVPVERAFAEIEWLRTAGAIVPGQVPQVLGQDDASRSFVMPFLDAGFSNWKAALLAGHASPLVARAVGDMVGRIHAATADDTAVAARFRNDAQFHALRLEPYLVETARVHPALAPALYAIVATTAATRRVLVHGDVSPKNVLIGPQGPVLLDAECAWFGDPAFDVAFCLNHFLLKAAHRPAAAADLMACVSAFWTAYVSQVHWETAAALEARVAALMPALALARVDGKSPVEYLGEPQRDAVRRAAIALLQRDGRALAALLDHWNAEFTP